AVRRQVMHVYGSCRAVAAQRLADFLGILAALRSAGNWPRADEVRQVLMQLLMDGDKPTQLAALECLQRYKNVARHVKPYVEQLTQIINQDRSVLREVLQKLTLGGADAAVKLVDLEVFLP